MISYDSAIHFSNISEKNRPELRVVNLAVLTYNALDDTKRFLESVNRYTKVPFNIFFFDNCSKDETWKWLEEQEQDNLFFALSNRNWGVPGGRNRLIEISKPYLPSNGFLIFCDNDLEFTGDWASIYLQLFAAHPEIGMAAAHGHRMRVFADFRRLFPHPKATSPVDLVCGGFVCWIRKAVIDDVGSFDENLGLFWHEDDDYAIRALEKGWQIYAVPHTPVLHHEHKSGVADEGVPKDGSPENQRYLVNKWRSLGMVDAFGDIKQPYPCQISTERHEIYKGIFCEGISGNQGGYYILEPRAELIVSPSSESRVLNLKLQCVDAEDYDIFPFSISVAIEGRVVTVSEFKESFQTEDVAVSIAASKTAQRVVIESSAVFNPFLVGMHVAERRNFSLRLSRIEVSSQVCKKEEVLELTPIVQTREVESGIKWVGPLTQVGEFGKLLRTMLLSLCKRADKCGIEDTGRDSFLLEELRFSKEQYSFWKRCFATEMGGGTAIIAWAAAEKGDLKSLLAQRNSKFRLERSIGITDNFVVADDPDWLASFKEMDEIWVPGENESRILRQNGLSAGRIKELPLGVDTDFICPKTFSAFNSPWKQDCNFFSVIRWDENDGWDLLVSAFLRAFAAQDRVRLLLFVTSGSSGLRSWQDQLKSLLTKIGQSHSRLQQILVFDPWLSSPAIWQLYACGGCYVQSVCSSSLGISVLEALAMELPVIVPDTERFRRVVSPEIGYLVSGSRVDQAPTVLSQRVVEISRLEPAEESLISCFREVYHNRAAAINKGKLGRSLVEKSYSSRQVSQWLSQRLDSQRRLEQEGTDSDCNIATTKHDLSHQFSEAILSQKESLTIITAKIPQVLSIGVDARSLNYSEIAERGIGQYTANHLNALVKETPNWRYVIFEEDKEPSTLVRQLLNWPNVGMRPYEAVHDCQLDLLHIIDLMSMLPHYESALRIAPRNLPLSVVFYDLIPILMPQMHINHWPPERVKSYYRRLSQLRCSDALVLTISESTRRELHLHAQIPLDRMVAIMAGQNLEGVGNGDVRREEARSVLSKFDLADSPFFLMVGALDSHKDPTTSISGFLTAQQHIPNLKLTIVGSFMDPNKAAFKQQLEQMGVRGVVFTGFLNRADINILYASACGVLFTSLCEGFGFPVLEAMANNCPVITTDTTSLPEVAGDAAIIVGAGDVAGVAQGVVRLAQDEAFRNDLKRRGLIQASKFTWEKVAQKTIAAWIDFLGKGGAKLSATEVGRVPAMNEISARSLLA